jgi:hypothetical protein
MASSMSACIALIFAHSVSAMELISRLIKDGLPVKNPSLVEGLDVSFGDDGGFVVR